MVDLEQNISSIKARVTDAAERSGRNPADIYIVGVTKNFPPEVVQKAIDVGLNLFGENRVQEARSKIKQVKGDAKWHLIGHLQRNKVKHAVSLFSMIQSVDSYRLANEINKRAKQANRVMDILVQINIGQEESKYGINPGEVGDFIESISDFSYLKIRGLMTIAPFKQNTEDVRPYFRRMKEIFEKIKQKSIQNVSMDYLSMGMSNDFEVAIEEGANMIRIGTGIFGERLY